MKLTLFIIALLSIASFTNAETFLAAKVRQKVSATLSPKEFTEHLKQSEFGKTILSLASLQFKSSGKLDDVNNLLQSLSAKIQSQQDDDDQQYTTTTASNTQIINDQTAAIATANANIDTYTTELNNDKSALAQLKVEQAALEAERDLINEQLVAKAQIRASDAANFEERVKNQDVLIQGLENTIVIFQQALQGKTVDQDAADKILALLRQLVSAFEASIAQDQQQEAQTIQDYNDWVFGRNTRLGEIEEAHAKNALDIGNLETAIQQLTDAIATQIETRDNAQDLKDKTIAAQQALDERYNNNKVVRTQQLQLLATASSTLNNNSADVQSYLNQA